MNLEKKELLLILLIIVSFVINIIFINSFLRGWDETVYLNLGRDLSLNPLSYSLQNSSWTDFIPSNDLIYGWPNIGFRAPLLPYLLALVNFLKLSFLIPLIIPIMVSASIYLIYILGKELFDKEAGLYGAILFALTPIIILCSGKIWVDSVVVFFILLTFISFWKGFELNIKKHKYLFGVFFALAILTRFTAMWIAPVFLIYFILKDKSFKFLKDKYLWFAVIFFFYFNTLVYVWIYIL